MPQNLQTWVEIAAPGFRVLDNNSTWLFELAPLDDGRRTRLIQRRDVSGGLTRTSRRLVDRFLGGEDAFEKELLSGMRQTVAAIRRTVEQD